MDLKIKAVDLGISVGELKAEGGFASTGKKFVERVGEELHTKEVYVQHVGPGAGRATKYVTTGITKAPKAEIETEELPIAVRKTVLDFAGPNTDNDFAVRARELGEEIINASGVKKEKFEVELNAMLSAAHPGYSFRVEKTTNRDPWYLDWLVFDWIYSPVTKAPFLIAIKGVPKLVGTKVG